MEMKRIKIEVAPKGSYTITALEGFTGTSCVEKTQNLELALGGQIVSEGKTTSYYDPDEGVPVFNNL